MSCEQKNSGVQCEGSEHCLAKSFGKKRAPHMSKASASAIITKTFPDCESLREAILQTQESVVFLQNHPNEIDSQTHIK